MTVNVDSVYAQLVPSATRESALTNQQGGARSRFMVASTPNNRTASLIFAQVTGGHSRSFLTTACLQQSLTLSIAGGVYADDGKGELTHRSGSDTFSRITIDYETGEINAWRPATYTGNASATYRPAAAVSGQAVTGKIDISLGNRGYAYTLNLAGAKPRPGTLSVSFMALGKWYELRDQGNGELVGEGSGTVDFASGAVSVSLDALPDVDSSIVFSYVSQLDDNIVSHVGTGPAPDIQVEHRLLHDGIDPGSVTVTAIIGGDPLTMADAGDGMLSGPAGIGLISYGTGEVSLRLVATPDPGSSIQFSYERAGFDVDTPLTASPDTGGIVSGIIPGAPFKPGTVNVRWQSQRKQTYPSTSDTRASYTGTVMVDHEANDNGAGGWVGYVGSINYATGAFSLRVEQMYDYHEHEVRYELRKV